MALPNCSQSLFAETSIEQLIEEIEKRPALYKKNVKEYADVNLKKKLWEEVCEAIVPDWNELSAIEKTQQGHNAQKRWANLRTCFRRELNAQKGTTKGQAATRRRKYIYFEKLLFLHPCMENRETEVNLDKNESQNNSEDDEKPGPSVATPIRQRQTITNVPKQTGLDEALIKPSTETNTIDEDTNFALSLVPSLQNLNAEEKLDAKIGILNVFKQIRLARRLQTTSQSINSFNLLQELLSSFPVNHRGSNILPPQQPLQTHKHSSTPSPNSALIQNISSQGSSNDAAQSQLSNFSDDSQMYDL